LASQIDDKNKLAQKNEDSLRITDDVLKSRDQTINELKEKVKYLKNKLEDSCSRIDKCNQIIEKHEKDVMSLLSLRLKRRKIASS
jgi:phage-related tail protein